MKALFVVVIVAIFLVPTLASYQNRWSSDRVSSTQAMITQSSTETSSIISNSLSSTSSTSSNPTSTSLFLDRSSGPAGTAVALSGRGYTPDTQFEVCIGTLGKTVCGFDYVGSGYPTSIGRFATLGNFTSDSGGNIPAGSSVTIPDLFGGSYVIAVVLGNSDFVVSTLFTVTSPTLSLSSIRAVAGASLTLTGVDYAQGVTYTVCLVPQKTVDCGYVGDREETPPGIYVGTFTSDQSGNIPPGTKVTIPLTLPPGEYAIGTFVPNSGFILISTSSFTLNSPT